jgi:hypothetical protein
LGGWAKIPILALHVAEGPQSLLEGLDRRPGAGEGGLQHADPGDFPRQLHLTGEQWDKDGQGKGHEAYD